MLKSAFKIRAIRIISAIHNFMGKLASIPYVVTVKTVFALKLRVLRFYSLRYSLSLLFL
jgi:hypothetical protein